ncbi:hypothetical protein CYMTET_12332 [Cymbomonas tetramitiformis]|uniref:Uncharacterized protein n=1 Tax=Cymbomonas tetramitiformis TaxID=36881 RepID=A0AAE0GK91_9CHLO|nr:hypothetical protein CYMTET_12331 [Cymbomonas tetramitiformis]KAK3279795.1 hypothetical protein CYMTET_12332 [Cymbomonas tetramitiformis]
MRAERIAAGAQASWVLPSIRRDAGNDDRTGAPDDVCPAAWDHPARSRAKQAHVAQLLEQLGLSQYSDQPAGTYSGGNRRKLSVGIALVGRPTCVLLDEPSTGMDPGAQRAVWDLISRGMQDHAVVLTSHRMEECEALCTRVGIMVDGRLRCVGSAEHLKWRFGNGYDFEFRINGGEEQREAIGAFVAEALPKAFVQEESKVRLKYHLEQGGTVELSELFAKMYEACQQFGVDDYGVSQTSLEQVFLTFARAQQDMSVVPDIFRHGGGSEVTGTSSNV